MRRPRCFVFDQQLRVCEVLTLSKPKRTVTPYIICISTCPCLLHTTGQSFNGAKLKYKISNPIHVILNNVKH